MKINLRSTRITGANNLAGLLLLALGLEMGTVQAQTAEPTGSLRTEKSEPSAQTEVASLLIYNRTIIDSKGNVRTDQNVVPNFRLNRFLKLELGYRLGERPQSHRVDSYDHYKIELQTKSFWNTLRFLARMSSNIIQTPTPAYTKSNYLAVAEAKYPLGRQFSAQGGFGYLVSFQKNNEVGATPVTSGARVNHVLYKLALRYAFSSKGFVEGVYGVYDVFNPYQLNEPFLQVACEYEFSDHTTLYSYVRYQYARTVSEPLNVFQCVGVRIHFFKKEHPISRSKTDHL